MTNMLTNFDHIASRHDRLFQQMTVDRCHTIAVVDFNAVPKTATPTSLKHAPAAGRINKRTGLIRDIDAIVETTEGHRTPTETRSKRTTCWPHPNRGWRREIIRLLQTAQSLF